MERDEQLVRRCLGGERAAFDRLYDRHERRVFGLLHRLTGSETEAADLAQETFLAAYRNLVAWRGQGAFSTWLCGIAARLAADAGRRAAGRELEPLDEADSLLAADPDPLAHCARRELEERLSVAIAALPAPYREVFVLVRVEGLSYREVAAALDVPVGTVQSRLARAARRLQVALADLAEEEPGAAPARPAPALRARPAEAAPAPPNASEG